MKKLDKSKAKVLATTYKEWVDELEKNNLQHDEHSVNHKYYYDVVANLLLIQKGLCAYSEQFLFDSEELEEAFWKDGVFTKSKFQFFGELEHYDASIKQSGRAWLWENLFVAHSDLNRAKWQHKVKYALKPDAEDYDPFKLLEYNISEHKFLPNRKLPFKQQEEILNDIKFLGLNYTSLIQARRYTLKTIIEEIEFEQKTLAEARKTQREYVTAFEMIIMQLQIK